MNSFVTLFGYRFPSDGVFRSDDHGDNWYKVLDMDTLWGTGDHIASELRMSPHNADNLFAATDDGIAASFDGGESWESVTTVNITDIEFHPTDAMRVYCSGVDRYRYSEDGGQTWNISSGVGPCAAGQRWEMAVSPDAPNEVTLLVPNGTDTLCGIYRSTDKGETYALIDNSTNVIEGQSNYNLGIALDPDNDDRVFVGALTGWRTNNISAGTPTWTNVAPFWEPAGSQQGTLPTNYVHPDIHDVAYNSLDGKLYACSDGGVYVYASGLVAGSGHAGGAGRQLGGRRGR